ncbi:MAG: Gx transporter family protein [Lachnospiraceae bacterium]|nr:Gx transporter family protein [Lachnospiraceae bacterium]
MSALLALSLIIGYVEYLIPLPVGIPGVKPGIANVIVLICLMFYGWKEAFLILLLRIFLQGFLFGNFFGTVFSLFGGILAFLAMSGAYALNGEDERLKLSIIGISMIGGVFHNIGQTLAAAVLIDELRVISYLPVLMSAGLLSGALTGVLAFYLKRPLEKILTEYRGGSHDRISER